MKKNILAVLIASSIGLYGCGDESEVTGNPTIDPIIEKSLKAETKILFDLASKTLVLPTFLAMDTTDGTLATEQKAKDPTNWADPTVAMGKTDGWSTTQPIVIEFTGNDLEPSMNADGFYLIESNDPTATNQTNTPKLLPASDFQVMASGTKLTVILKKPLNPASNYMFAITDELKDVKGNSVGMTGSYATLKATAEPALDDLIPVQAITHATEKEFNTAGVSADSIIFSSWFTTSSAGVALQAARSATALSLASLSAGGNGAADIWKDQAKSSTVSDAEMAKLFTMTVPTATGQTPGGNAIYTGSVYLPYFLEASTDTNTVSYKAVLGTPWQSALPSLAKISYVLENGTTEEKAAVMQKLGELNITTDDLSVITTDLAVQARVLQALTGETITLPSGQLDSERLITQYSPIPQLKSVQEVEYTMVVPAGCSAQANAGANSIAIYQHGITSKKDVLVKALSEDGITDGETENTSVADALIDSGCQVIFAIDHPLHNTRKVVTSEGVTLDASAASGLTHYMNLGVLPVGRDNLRQSAIDIVNFRASIGVMLSGVGAKLTAFQADPTSPEAGAAVAALGPLALLNPAPDANGLPDVALVGHSLGAISGVTATQIGNENVSSASDAAALAKEKYLFNFKSVALASPGAGIAHLLLRSGSYGPLVKGSVLAGDTEAEGQAFLSYCTSINLTAEQCPGAFSAYQTKLIGDDNTTELTKIYGKINLFAYAAQTVLDPADPISYGSKINSTTPVYLNVVEKDLTIPNKLTLGTPIEAGIPVLEPYSAFAGTMPLISEMSLTPTVNSVANQTVKHAAMFTKGHHSSINTVTDADNKPVTTEMHKEIKSLLVNGGQSLDIDNTDDVLTTAYSSN